MPLIYLDNNATTRPAPEVVQAMHEALTEHWANPSSSHRAGQAVRRTIDLARQSVAQLIGCKDRDLVFTSGGTESANLAVCGSLGAQPEKKVLVTTHIEHSAVRETAKRLENQGIEVIWLPNDDNGVIDVSVLDELLRRRASEIALVAVMWSNNETGVIQPIQAIGTLCQQHGVRFYTDGTQWVGKMPTNLAAMPIDLLGFASHKFHGPKGIGGLYIKPRTRLISQTIGGHQERNRRGGTENVPGIIGMGVAAELAHAWLQTDGRDRMAGLRDHFEQTIVSTIEGATVNGAAAPRQWNTSNIAFSRLEAEAILMLLSERGVCASGGSACASGSIDPSPVLQAMHLPMERTHGSVRFSLCRHTTQAEIDQAIEIIQVVISRLRNSMAAVATSSA
jgi:cysteine desulfurase